MDEPEVVKRLPAKELEEIFNLNYYLRNINHIFRRMGLK